MAPTQRKNITSKDDGGGSGSTSGGGSGGASSSDKKQEDNKKKAGSNDKKKEQQPQPQVSLSDQLNRAQAAVESSQMHAFRLHSQWRSHLLKLSYIVIIITLHQMQTPTSACMKEIKHWNEIKQNSMEEPMSGYEAFWIILNDSHVEILSVICAGCLSWCLSLPMLNRDFDTVPYKMSCSVVPLIVSLFFSHKQNPSSYSGSCLPSSEKQQYIEDSTNDEAKERPFPIILVFHLIVSISLFFMRYQQQQQEENVELVRQMRQDLQIAQQSKKKS